MNTYDFSLLAGIVLFVITGWGLISFFFSLSKSYKAIRQKEEISTVETVRSLIRANIVILFAVGVIIIFTSEEITPQTIVVSFVNGVRDISGIIILSVFCAYQVHKYNTNK